MNYLLLTEDMGAIISKIATTISSNFSGDCPAIALQFSQTTTGVINAISTGSFSNLIDGFVPIGCMMAMIYLSKEFFEKTTLKNIDVEQIFKMLVKLVIACILVSNVKSLIIGMNTFTIALTDEINSALTTVVSTDPNDTWEALVDNITTKDTSEMLYYDVSQDGNKGSLFDGLATIIFSLFSLLGTLIYTVAIEFISYSRAITIGYKSLYAPIAVSNIVGYSTRNAAISYLKSMLATFMQMPIAILGSSLSSATAKALITTNPLLAIIVFFLGIGWIAGSQRVSKELFC